MPEKGKVIQFPKRNEETYELVLAFLDQSASFTFGFVCGELWNELKNSGEVRNYLLPDECLEQAKEIARKLGKELFIDAAHEQWNTISIV